MKNRSEVYPIRNITFEWVDFHDTDMWKSDLWNVLGSINDGSNVWVDQDGKAIKEGIAAYNKELSP